MASISSARAKLRIKPAVEMMAGLPSVVLGFLAALVLAPAATAAAKGLKPIARLVAFGGHAQDPVWFTTAPVVAAQRRAQFADVGHRLVDDDGLFRRAGQRLHGWAHFRLLQRGDHERYRHHRGGGRALRLALRLKGLSGAT